MKRRILVVEDDASLARVLCDNLVYEGFDVALAGDGHVALKQHALFNPDLVLLDLTLPGLDGFEVCRRLNREQSRTGIIVLTARVVLRLLLFPSSEKPFEQAEALRIIPVDSWAAVFWTRRLTILIAIFAFGYGPRKKPKRTNRSAEKYVSKLSSRYP